MWESFEQSLNRFRELEQQLADPVVIADRARYTRTAKEHGTLAKQVKPYAEFKKLAEEIAQIEPLAQAEPDPSMRHYYEEELAGLQHKYAELKAKLEELLLVEPGEV